MIHSTQFDLPGVHGRVAVRTWAPDNPTHVALVAHGYGEHSGRYQHVADALTAEGAVVYAPDHAGHGLSDGEPARLDVVEDMVTDLHALVGTATTNHPRMPIVLIGHSMGGIIAVRFVQRYGSDQLAALVLSGPAIGGNPGFGALLGMDPLPEIPIDPAVLSRDPNVGAAYLADPLVYHGALQTESAPRFMDVKERIAESGPLGDVATLWIHGELDQLAPLEDTGAAIEIISGPNLTSKVYEGAQHEVFNETNRDDVLSDVTAFIQEHVR